MTPENPSTGTWQSNPVGYNQPLHDGGTCRKAAVGAASILTGAGIGAALMYLLDPEEGHARRQTLATRATHAAETAGSTFGNAWQHVSDAAHDFGSHVHEARSRIGEAGASAAHDVREQSSAATGWLGSKFDRVRDSLPSMGSVRQHANPRNWFHQDEPSVSERYMPSAGAAIGAGTLALATVAAMYFLDPQSGRRRRALVRDKMVRGCNETSQFLRVAGRHLSNRARGFAHERTDHLTGRHAPATDRQLAARVSAHLGHVYSRGSVQVDVENGTVYLRGNVSADEIAKVVKTAEGMRGVRNVVNFLTVTDNLGSSGSGGAQGISTSTASQI